MATSGSRRVFSEQSANREEPQEPRDPQDPQVTHMLQVLQVPQELQDPQAPQEFQQPQDPQNPEEPQPEVEVISPWLPEPHHINHMPLRRLCADINDEIIEAMFCQGGLDIVEAAKENSRNNDQQVNKGMWEFFVGKYQEKIKEQLPGVIEAMENMVIRLNEIARVDDAQVVGAVEQEKKEDEKKEDSDDEDQVAVNGADGKEEEEEEDKDQAMDYYHEHNENDSEGEEIAHLWDVQEEDEEKEDDVNQFGDIQESTV